MGNLRVPNQQISRVFLFLTTLILGFVSTSAISAESVLEVISDTQNSQEIDHCVLKINESADDSLSTAERLYQTGICYLCAGCDLESDNGNLFQNRFSTRPNAKDNYEIAYKLMQQSADLGSQSSNYGLAVLMFSKNLDENKITKDKIVARVFQEFKSEEQNKGLEEDALDTALDSIKNKVYAEKHDLDFSDEIHLRLLNAARDGHIPAQFALSEVYSKGIGVAPNKVHAYAWAATAVAQNPPFGSDRRDTHAINLDSFEINEAESLAVEFMKDHTTIFDRSSVTVMR